MKPKRVPLFALVFLLGLTVLAPRTTPVLASSAKSGILHVTKDCTHYTGDPGSHCIITSSNLPQIAVGSRVFYGQPAGIPIADVLDSNVVLDAGNGNRAVGRCMLDLSTGQGLCAFSGGTGDFAAFDARVDVFPPADTDEDWLWSGTYGFTPGTGRPPHSRK